MITSTQAVSGQIFEQKRILWSAFNIYTYDKMHEGEYVVLVVFDLKKAFKSTYVSSI